MSKQIITILSKAKIDKMNSISMPILVKEPSTKEERTLFFKTLPKACAAFIKESIYTSVKVIRIVSDDLETLNDAAREFEDWKANPTYLDSNSSLNKSFIGN